MQRFNQTQGVRTVQVMYGCEWDNETTGGLLQYGYDGEDFITYDLKNQRFIGPTPQASITAQKLNNDPALLKYLKQYLTLECVEWLKKYVSYGRSALERTGTAALRAQLCCSPTMLNSYAALAWEAQWQQERILCTQVTWYSFTSPG
uniref:MHC class I-like antigen recognition-like domain-containing protein n=1 Tax=Anguilla anguilla TaxID=7936 RepID=A0A0E9WND0_ANGAN